jgi:D-alanyl-lipoteichoic acid acyltransferase DltB (MBOAT superfamily)
MLFTEFSFILVFLPITLAAYYWVDSTSRTLVVLVIASLFFYGIWNYRLVPVLVVAIVVNYCIAIRIERTGNNVWFIFGALLALIPLIYFKYSGFLIQNSGFKISTGIFGEKLGSLLPLGISFYTFQQITYLSDVRLGKIKAGGFLEYAFFKTFFPQLIAGPIVHYQQLVPQVGRNIQRERMFLVGLIYFGIGFVKKFFLADGFAAFSDPIFDGADPIDTQAAIIATLGYTFQIYFDFSGYSDMALGLARLFGFELPWNFNSPYKARSISDFWRRWHMTLSQFLRDYIYIPLGGNRYGEIIQYRNLLLTMLIGGLWHGAAWTFVIWGGLHGLALAIDHLWSRLVRVRLYGAGYLLTFSLVALLWVLFRATSFERAWAIYHGLLTFSPLTMHAFWKWALAGIAAVLLLPNSQQIAETISRSLPPISAFQVAPLCKRLGVYAAVSSVMLYAMTAIYYTTSIDRIIYSYVDGPTVAFGMSNVEGDFRNNLWAKEIFSAKVRRIILAGSSFVGSAGEFQIVDSSGITASSQTLGMGGNGILNGARQVDAVARAKAVDVAFLGVSPLNFGTTIPYAPFPGQCMKDIAAVARAHGFVLDEKVDDCFASKFDLGQYLHVFDGNHASVSQFRNFTHTLALSVGRTKRIFPDVSIVPTRIADELAAVKRDIAAKAAQQEPLFNPHNGEDTKFAWRSRKIMESLRPGGLGYVILAHLQAVSKENGVQLIVYETPTVSHSEAPAIYPEGFFEEYQTALRKTLAEIGIPYLDLSRMFPWGGQFAFDFIHLRQDSRQSVHKVLLSWLYAPEALRRSGLIADNKIPANPWLEKSLP